MRRSEEGRVEELSKRIGGRFKLTTLVQRQARDYVRGGGAFMPKVRNLHELYRYILDEIDAGKIELQLRGEVEQAEETEEEEGE